MSLATNFTDSISYIQLSLVRPFLDIFRTVRRRIAAAEQSRLEANIAPINNIPQFKYTVPGAGKFAQKSLKGTVSWQERRLICKSWRKIPSPLEFCERIYMHIFLLKPGILVYFPFAHVPLDHVRTDPEFLRQAKIFANFLDKAVEFIAVDDAKSLRDFCWWAGERHRHQKQVENFQVEWFRLFKPALLDCLQPYCRTHTVTLSAWGKIMNDIIETMSLAFDSTMPGTNLVDTDGATLLLDPRPPTVSAVISLSPEPSRLLA